MIDFTTNAVSESTIVVEISGNLAGIEREYFFKCIGDLVDSGYQNIVIECNQLGYVNSGGLATLLAARSRAARNGSRIYLTELNSSLADILELTKLGGLLKVYATTEEAIENAASGLTLDTQ